MKIDKASHIAGKLPAACFAVWIGTTVWCVSSRFIDPEITPKTYAALFGGSLFFLSCVLAACFPSAPPRLRFADFSAAILLCATSQAIYALLQWGNICPANGSFVSGTFDNPAGLASLLAFSLPFALHRAISPRPLMRLAAWAAIVLLAAGTIVSESRSGFMAMGISGLVFVLTRWPELRRPSFLVVASILLTLSSTALYHYKKDSADGRLFIWKCTWELIQQRPWFGYGVGGFQTHYMHAQADYFRHHPDSPYARLADDVKDPFNEYLGLLANHGLAGMAVLFSAIVLLLCAYRKHHSASSRSAMLCLLSVAIFSLFSYPSRYPHTYLLGGLSAAVLLLNAWPTLIRTAKLVTVTSATGFMIISAQAFERMQAEMRWCETAHRALCGMTEKMLPAYQELYAVLKNDPLFLYNYAAELNVAGQYGESLRVGLECESQIADYFTQILQADNHKQLGNYQEAERHLLQASYMCPNRFVPFYELYKLQKMRGDTVAMRRTATAILQKPVKVDSPEVQRILSEIRREQQNADKKQLASEPQKQAEDTGCDKTTHKRNELSSYSNNERNE